MRQFNLLVVRKIRNKNKILIITIPSNNSKQFDIQRHMYCIIVNNVHWFGIDKKKLKIIQREKAFQNFKLAFVT